MSQKVDPIPEGYHAITPHLVVKGCAAALEFYKKAFGAEETIRMPMPGSDLIMHAELQIGDSKVMLVDEMPNMQCLSPQHFNGTPVTIHLMCEDVDAMMKQAEEAGATVNMPPADMFWGDRYGKLTDPYGHSWSVATHIADPTMEEMQQAMEAMMGGEE
ncbi:VOC family protein [Sulfidibacter corallicola]|uniref:VOC family protein n=1 Tax=Sulfidibacter corallicola TaxID=2818388 RepID=A0A8A4TPW7_SULCO|nr:VOC family protein [Sulfidibacter corallicola]QTD51477.1 VOC family protein [Sulfidibacter corallicola]